MTLWLTSDLISLSDPAAPTFCPTALSLEPARFPRPFPHAASTRPRFPPPPAHPPTQVIEIRPQPPPPRPGRREIIPVVLEQRLLQIAVTQPARTETIFKV